MPSSNRRLAWPLKWYGACPCRALEKQASPEEGAPSKEVLELRKELFMKLGWEHWARQESDRLRTAFPQPILYSDRGERLMYASLIAP